MQKFNNTLKQSMVKEEITREIIKYTETNETKNTTYQNLRYAAKTEDREKIIAVNIYIKKE